MIFLPICRSRFKKHRIPPLISLTNVLRVFEDFWVIFGHFVKEIFFFDNRLNWGKYEILKTWWIWKVENWSEELVDGHQTVPYQPGAFFWGVNCLVVFPTHVNPNNSFLKLFQISLLFRFTPDLIRLIPANWKRSIPQETKALPKNRIVRLRALVRPGNVKGGDDDDDDFATLVFRFIVCIRNWPLPFGAFHDQCKQTIIH